MSAVHAVGSSASWTWVSSDHVGYSDIGRPSVTLFSATISERRGQNPFLDPVTLLIRAATLKTQTLTQAGEDPVASLLPPAPLASVLAPRPAPSASTMAR